MHMKNLYRHLFTVSAVVLIQANAGAALIHEYRFDGNLNDSAGSWNAVGQGSPQLVNGSAPQGSGYLSLNGSSSLRISSTGLPANFTIAAWFSNPLGIVGPQTIIANGASGGNASGFKLFANRWESTAHNNGAIVVETGTGSSGAGVASPDGAVANNQWHHIVFVANRSSSTGSLYCDGLAVGQGSIKSGFSLFGDLYIGKMSNDAYPLNGYIDDVRIYDSALTASEAQALSAVPEPGTTALWAGSMLAVVALLKRVHGKYRWILARRLST